MIFVATVFYLLTLTDPYLIRIVHIVGEAWDLRWMHINNIVTLLDIETSRKSILIACCFQDGRQSKYNQMSDCIQARSSTNESNLLKFGLTFQI